MNNPNPRQLLNIPSNGKVDFDFRQPTGPINDEHAALLGKTFAQILRVDAHPAFVKSLANQLTKMNIADSLKTLFKTK